MASETTVHIGERLRHYRRQQNLTQAQFAKRAKLALSHYRDIEKGQVDVRFPTLYKVTKAAGVHISSILGDSPTVKEFFVNECFEAPKWLQEIFERVEQDAFKEGKYWMRSLIENYTEIGGILHKMIAVELQGR